MQDLIVSSTFKKRKETKKEKDLRDKIDLILVEKPDINVSKLSKELKCSESVIRKRKNNLGIVTEIKPNYKSLNSKQMALIEEEFKNHTTPHMIARHAKISVDRVKRYLKEEGFEIPETQIKNENSLIVSGEKTTVNVGEMTNRLVMFAAEKKGICVNQFKEKLKTDPEVIKFFMKCKREYVGEIVYSH